MSFRIASVAVIAAVTAVMAGCVVEQPRPRPVYVAQPAPQPEYVEVAAPAPPPVYIETVPPPREGWVWARGYYSWRGGRWVGVGGHWERGRPGYHYVHPHWEQGGGGWHFRAGIWVAG